LVEELILGLLREGLESLRDDRSSADRSAIAPLVAAGVTFTAGAATSRAD
jgi:hypothetical protein